MALSLEQCEKVFESLGYHWPAPDKFFERPRPEGRVRAYVTEGRVAGPKVFEFSLRPGAMIDRDIFRAVLLDELGLAEEDVEDGLQALDEEWNGPRRLSARRGCVYSRPMPASFGDVYQRYVERYPDARERGRHFESLVADVLRTDPMYRQRFAEVWRWLDWPDRDGSDIGIDIVARRHDGGYVAIQCKCYQPGSQIPKGQIDSFLAESQRSFNGKRFVERIIVSTADLSGNAQRAITSIDPPVHLLNLFGLEETTIDWDAHLDDPAAPLLAKPHRKLHPHQEEALRAVHKGFAAHDRGKLIMACGTGKTLTALRIAEEVAGRGGRVLFAAPSISLLAQALGNWGADARMPLRFFAVCSDENVGRGRDGDSARPYDLPLPASTKAGQLAAEASRDAPDAMTVVFSTYQSMQVIAEAQARGMPEFDLVICDEAHRTTGHGQSEERSHFRLVHDGEAIRAGKRLYMTATPRIYSPALKQRAEDADVTLDSMDDESTYGPEFHRLGFATAVEQGLLSDYKVTVLVMSEKRIARDFQKQLASGGEGLKVHDVGRVIGCLNGLAKRDPEHQQFKDDFAPMHRAVAFSNTIKASEHFVQLVHQLQDETGIAERGLKFEAHHVDGKSGVRYRSDRLRWLGSETLVMEQQCNILSNARCLTEGIDVPALDAVLFLQPRKSQIDVVQAVGRVMRRAEGKKYGYIILPVVVPADEDPARALDRNDAYAHVWEVLQALRSHDERFDAYVNKIDMGKRRDGPVQVIGVGHGGNEREGTDLTGFEEEPAQYDLGLDIEQWRDAIYAKIVQRCGDRQYWTKWADDISEIARLHQERINFLIANPDSGIGPRFDEFIGGLRSILNGSITADDAAAMLSQHLITKPVFDALFGGSHFTERNPIAQVMERMLAEMEGRGLEAETAKLDEFYTSVRRRVEGIDNAADKQHVVSELYGRFFRTAFPMAADRLGIVYTPVEIVDFIIQSVEHILNREFNASLGSEGVHVLDPFTGTGTYIIRLLQSDLLGRDDIIRKYASELHANDIMLLAYYIAAVNIETAFAEITGYYQPFRGIVLTDTFQSSEDYDRRNLDLFPRNNERIERQIALDIRVIISNPPWSARQLVHEHDNANQPYPALDGRISSSYIANSGARGLKSMLYDSYVRAIRWASDRVQGADGGVIGFVTNSGFLDSKSFDGFRKSIGQEFHEIYIYNLRGNARTSSEQRRKEGGGIFDVGSRAGVAIILLVKRQEPVTEPAVIRYYDIGDYLSREEKLERIKDSSFDEVDWKFIAPNAQFDWINQRNPDYLILRPLAGIQSEAKESTLTPLLHLSSLGVITSRDAWVWNSSRADLTDRVEQQVSYYNSQMISIQSRDDMFTRDSRYFKWDGTTEQRARRGIKASVSSDGFRDSLYRPFFRQNLYLDRVLNNSVYQLPQIFPRSDTRNPSILFERGLSTPDRTPTILAADTVVDTNFATPCQVLPRYFYDSSSGATQSNLLDFETGRRDNITDDALAAYQSRYGDSVTKDDIFAYVYGILHSPDYRQRYATDLAKLLPRIPEVATADAFHAFADAGQRLLDLHIGYEDAEPYPLDEVWAPLAPDDPVERHRVEKMRWGGKRGAEDRTAIVYNEWLTLAGIPDEAHGYVVGPRTALEWLIDRYRVRVDKASGIVNDVNDWGLELSPPNPRYIVELVKRIVTVSVETVRIVASLPPLDEAPPQ